MNRSRVYLVLAAVALSAGGANAVQAQASNTPAVLAGGRYVFGQINEYNADQYMLDTQTGRLWRLVDTADGSGSILEPVPYAMPDGRSQLLPPDAEAEAAAAAAAQVPGQAAGDLPDVLLPPPRR